MRSWIASSPCGLARGERVFHIMPDGRLAPAQLTPGARPGSDGTVVYPASGRRRVG
jgi:hypothetical protein